MAEPLVFLPGMMCDARLFGPQIVELSADTCVTVAPITQGERVEEIASNLLDQLPARFALAGLSMGGIIAMELLRRAPDRITRIALKGTLRKCKVPTLVLCGAHDQICPVKRHTFMAELIPFAELVVLENAGHFMTLDAPAATTAAIREWMK